MVEDFNLALFFRTAAMKHNMFGDKFSVSSYYVKDISGIVVCGFDESCVGKPEFRAVLIRRPNSITYDNSLENIKVEAESGSAEFVLDPRKFHISFTYITDENTCKIETNLDKEDFEFVMASLRCAIETFEKDKKGYQRTKTVKRNNVEKNFSIKTHENNGRISITIKGLERVGVNSKKESKKKQTFVIDNVEDISFYYAQNFISLTIYKKPSKYFQVLLNRVNGNISLVFIGMDRSLMLGNACFSNDEEIREIGRKLERIYRHVDDFLLGSIREVLELDEDEE